MDSFPEKIIKLKQRLELPLPGIEAQKIMAPYLTDPMRFDQEGKKRARPGAVMLLLYPDNDRILTIPFMKRTEYPGVHSGQISLPGGKREESDPDLRFTAIRESEEEMGIRPHHISYLGKLTDLFVTASNFNIEPFVFYSDQRPQFVPEATEVAEIIESRLDTLLHPNSVKETTIRIKKGISLRTPYFDLNGKVLWGATAMIMSEFLSVYKEL